jgi:hypothetical protein
VKGLLERTIHSVAGLSPWPARFHGRAATAAADGTCRAAIASRHGDIPAISAGQIQRWFEARTVLQAQEALQLGGPYGRFVTRPAAGDEAEASAGAQPILDLRRLTNPDTGTNDEPRSRSA